MIFITQPQLVSTYDSSKAYNGYTLFGPRGTRDVFLINMKGEFVQHWRTPLVLANYGKLLENGNLLVGQRIPDGPVVDLAGAAGQLLELNWDSNVVWKHEDAYMHAHDFERLENGNTLVGQFRPVPSDIAAKIKGGIPGSERDGVIWGDSIQEITTGGKVVWEWVGYEHIDFDTDILCPLCPRDSSDYTNSFRSMPDGNILAHFRQTNTVKIIDKGTGKIIWRWGPGQLGHAHDATLLDNGNILIFDNGNHSIMTNLTGNFSRVIEINIKTKKIVWEYRDRNPLTFYSALCGGARRLPNGNTLICEATQGRCIEISPGKEIVWEFTNPFFSDYRGEIYGLSNMVYRYYRYSPDYPGLRGKNLDPNRFEWVLQEKGRPAEPTVVSSEIPEIMAERIARLGY